jgi:transposase-like protein
MISAKYGGTFRRIWTQKEKETIVRLYQVERLTQERIAKRYGVGIRTISVLLRANGVTEKPNRSLTIE